MLRSKGRSRRWLSSIIALKVSLGLNVQLRLCKPGNALGFSSTILIYINYTFAAKITRFCIITQYHHDFKPDFIKKYMLEEKKLKYLSFLKNKPNKKISKNKIFLNFLGSVIVCGYFIYCDFARLTQEKKSSFIPVCLCCNISFYCNRQLISNQSWVEITFLVTVIATSLLFLQK